MWSRWVKRVLLALGALVMIALAAAIITIHTDYGRELIRKQAQARMNDTFIGGASIGKVEGSPFGELVIHDLVINGPDREPAITVEKLTLELGLLPLVSKQARMSGLVADGVEVVLARDANGELQIAHLTRKSEQNQPSGWSVDIADVEVHRGHVAIDAGTQGWMNFDDITIYGAAHMPEGEPLDANLSIRAAWRERAIGIGVDAVVSTFEGVTSIPSVAALLGGVTIAGQAIRITAGTAERAPIIEGLVIVNAPAVAVAQLVPGIELPADVALAVTARSAPPWTNLSALGQLGGAPVRGLLGIDLDARRARGVLAASGLELARLSNGKLDGTAGAVVMFDAARAASGMLPVASGVVATWGELLGEGTAAHAAVAFSSGGHDAATVIGLAGRSLRATVSAELRKVGTTITLERSRVVASTSSPARATGGKAPVHGALTANASVTGRLSPDPNLAVRARVDGRRLHMQGISVASLQLGIDAKQIPNQPLGRAELQLDDLVHEKMQLGQLKVTAANRPDGMIQVSLRSRPKQDPWLIDVDALVKPPGTGDVVTVDIQRHHIRAASAGNWRGTTGHLEIDPRRIVLRGFRSQGLDGVVEASGTFVRAGRRAGDLAARIDATSLDLDNFRTAYRGRVDAHLDVARTRGRWAGAVDLDARGISFEPSMLAFDLETRILGKADQLAIEAKASSPRIGAASLSLDVDAPKNILDLHAWTHLHRNVLRTGRIQLERIDLARLAELTGHEGRLSGRIDGDIQLSSVTAGGSIRVRKLVTPELRGLGELDAELQIAQTAPDELTPTLDGAVPEIGRFHATARVGMPGHLFDPDAWQALGIGALRGATLRVEDIAIDPGLLDRVGLVTQLRGKMRLSAELGPALRDAQVALELTELRGTPVAEPVTATFTAAVDPSGASTSLSVRAKSAMLVELRGTVPVTLDELRVNPHSVLDKPIDVTGVVPRAPAPILLGVFGRSEVTGGVFEGRIAITGTLRDPRVRANLVGSQLSVPPGPNNKPVKRIEQIRLEVAYDGTLAKVSIDGRQHAGSLRLAAVIRPRDLANGTLTLRARQFDLVPLLVFAPGRVGAGAGRLDADLAVTGLDPGTAKLFGTLHVTGARLPIAPQIGTLRRGNIDLVVNERQARIHLDGKLGPGDVQVDSTIGLVGARPTAGEATIKLHKVTPSGSVEPAIDATITATLARDGAQWKADLAVREGRIVVPERKGEKLKPVGAPSDMVFAVADRKTTSTRLTGRAGDDLDQPPQAPRLIARVRIYSLYVQSPEIRSLMRGTLTVTADAHALGIVGSIEADRGLLELFGRRYQLELFGSFRAVARLT